MSISRNIELTIGAVIILAVLGLFGYGKINSMLKEHYKEEAAVATGDAQAAEVVVLGTKRIAQQEQRKHEELEEALTRNPEWADAVVPSDIAHVLCHSPDAACQVPQGVSDH